MIKIISGIILAAGKAKRMGKQKLLLPFRGSTILENVIETVTSCKSIEEVIVIYGAAEIIDKVGKYNIKTVYNPIAEEGQSTSVIAGVKNSNPRTMAYMFIMGDQPFISPYMLEKLIDIWKQNVLSIIVPRYNGKNGMPTIFSADFRKDLMNITGDKGGRDVIKANPDKVKYVDMDDAMAGFDVDTPEDYEKLLKQI